MLMLFTNFIAVGILMILAHIETINTSYRF